MTVATNYILRSLRDQVHSLEDKPMISDQAGLSTTPLLLKFARCQRADSLDYRYDPAQSLNVATADGMPVVASAQGKSRLKTLKEFRGAED